MNLQGIVAVSGKPGLWKALTQNKTGFILESLDAQKTKLVANLSTTKLAALDEITIFGYDDDIKLTEVFERMKNTASTPDAKTDARQLREYFREVAPDHDEDRVYASDMKKVITWFNLMKDMPFFNETPAEPVAEEVPVTEEVIAPVAEPVAEAEAEKPAVKAKKPAKTEEAEVVAEDAPKAPAKPKAAKAKKAE